MNLKNQVGKFFLQYYSAINGGTIYFAGDFDGPWTRDLEQAKGYSTQYWALKAKDKLALKESAYCPAAPENIQLVRVALRPVIEVCLGEIWTPVHPSRWS